jgi:glycine oxidase
MPETMSASTPDLLIVGGGVIGLGLADAAARRGLKVTLLERERVGARASWAGAGMLNGRPWPRVRTPDYHDLVLASKKLYPEWSARLLEETDVDIGLKTCGALELYPPERATKEGLENLERMLSGCRARGVRAERITSRQARELEPGLNADGLAAIVHLPDDGQIRTPRLSKALAVACRQRGVEIQEGLDVADVWAEGGRVKGVVARDGTRHAAGKVAVCAGAWTGQFPALNAAAPRTGKIEPVRGQIVCYQAPRPLATRLLTVEHHYLVPRPDGITLAGSTMEHVGFEAVTTPEALADLRAFAEKLLPGLKGLEPLSHWADVRPGLKGSHPILGPVPGVAGLFVAAGHFRNGLILAPVTAEVLAALVAGEEPPVEIGPWLPQPMKERRGQEPKGRG